MARAGIRVVVVHGGGKDITAMAEKLGIRSIFIGGQRVTDQAMMEVVLMVLAGKNNKDIALRINQQGAKAVGICGIDAGLLKVRKMTGDVDLGLVGEITGVNETYLGQLLNSRITPVIAPIGTDATGQMYNINADVAAASIASALHAEKLLLLTDTDGVHADGARIPRLDELTAEELIASGVINNGMIPKMRSAFTALRNGVEAVHLVDGRVQRTLLNELIAGVPLGTELTTQTVHLHEKVL